MRRSGRSSTSSGTRRKRQTANEEANVSGTISRREFVGTTAGLVAGAAPLFGQGPEVLVPKAVKPVVISSSNGHRYKNGGPRTSVEEAFQRITRGEDVLDAV